MKTIMLIDDFTTILPSMPTILSKAGYCVEKAASAEEGQQDSSVASNPTC